ncbi:MAG: hypothetical protein LBN00_10025 [Oscillospiraceae bacterium]|jgi:hypothetical protein|nr:hypothetical protein [Oscillospiraceae bacterium]
MAGGTSNFNSVLPVGTADGDIRKLLREIIDYEIMLRRDLEYQLNHLDVRNMNETTLPEMSESTVAPVRDMAQSALQKIGDLAALPTVAKANLVAAIAELDADIAVLAGALSTLAGRVTALETISYTPVNFAVDGDTINDYLAGIDTKLGELTPPEGEE